MKKFRKLFFRLLTGNDLIAMTSELDLDQVNMLVDKIAKFFEREENWGILKNCWLVNGISKDLRVLLRKAITEEVK